MRRRFFTWSLVVLAVSSACRSGETLTEVQRIRAEALDVILLSPNGALRHGKDRFVIEFRSAAHGNLVDVGEVRGNATMPMGGTPMLGTVDVKRSDVAGRYLADAQLEMAGTWRTTVTWQGAAGSGSVTFSASAM
jgi:hypothetical protein